MGEEQQNPPQQQSNRRGLPQTDLELNMMVTNPVYGKPDIAEGLKKRLQKYYRQIGYDGTEEITLESLWDMLGFFTRDMRLANLSSNPIKDEVSYCKYYLDLASDYLQVGFLECFVICIERVASLTELSQSKNGFLRRRMNTFTAESLQGELEPPKKSLFGKGGGQQHG